MGVREQRIGLIRRVWKKMGNTISLVTYRSLKTDQATHNPSGGVGGQVEAPFKEILNLKANMGHVEEGEMAEGQKLTKYKRRNPVVIYPDLQGVVPKQRDEFKLANGEIWRVENVEHDQDRVTYQFEVRRV